MNRKQHEKWLAKHGVSPMQLRAKKQMLGKVTLADQLGDQHTRVGISIPSNGTKDHNTEMFKIKESSNFATMPAYNKGPIMVISKSELPYAGKK